MVGDAMRRFGSYRETFDSASDFAGGRSEGEWVTRRMRSLWRIR